MLRRALALSIAAAFAESPSGGDAEPWAADVEREMSVVMLQTSLAVERAQAALAHVGAPAAGDDESSAEGLEDKAPDDSSGADAEEPLPDGPVLRTTEGLLETPPGHEWRRPVSLLTSAALRAGVLERFPLRPFSQPRPTGGCGVASGEHHERCVCDEQEERFCRLECLSDHSCVGYVESTEGCEYATTSRCSRICRRSDIGNRGPIVSGPGGGGYLGCHVKVAWLHLPHWAEMTIDLGLPLLAVTIAFGCLWRRDFILEHATIPAAAVKEPPPAARLPKERPPPSPAGGAAGLLGRAGGPLAARRGP